jgi:hypothetical protein
MKKKLKKNNKETLKLNKSIKVLSKKLMIIKKFKASNRCKELTIKK